MMKFCIFAPDYREVVDYGSRTAGDHTYGVIGVILFAMSGRRTAGDHTCGVI
ncbi:MAG: hypothetical protein GY696_35545 [Gammaproteobacteria bacterium]|nr:hypothetical protein [Gammaproteobacteria bacterium]